MEQNELMHHGVRGQKWGVRRYQNADGSLTSAGIKRYGTAENFKKVQDAKARAEARKRAAKATARTNAEVAKFNSKNQLSEPSAKPKVTKKTIKSMPDKELNDNITRLQKEKQYKELVQGDNVTRGRRAVSEALTESGKQATRTIATAALTYAGKQAVKKLVGEATYNDMFDVKKNDANNSSQVIKDLKSGKKKYSSLSDNEMSAVLARMTKEEAIRNKMK